MKKLTAMNSAIDTVSVNSKLSTRFWDRLLKVACILAIILVCGYKYNQIMQAWPFLLYVKAVLMNPHLIF